MRSLWTLTEIPPAAWTKNEVWLLEHALTLRNKAPRLDRIRKNVDAILAHIRWACLLKPTDGFYMALCILSFAAKGPQTTIALEVMEHALQIQCSIPQNDLWKACPILVGLERIPQFAAQASSILNLVGLHYDGGSLNTVSSINLHSGTAPPSPAKDSETVSQSVADLSPCNSTSSPCRHSAVRRSLSLSTIRDRKPSMSESDIKVGGKISVRIKQDKHEQDSIPRDPARPHPRWCHPRRTSHAVGQPVFGGTQFQTPSGDARPVGKCYFKEFQRCRPATF
eukprot:TRINITY_DN90188_c0_g1_i1.p1 TRINITY_DN90188_c0_g1~~TRINITY_DN90188_c0_g1_i1.p1  ORF type:complete len:281 (+),score=23.82 TRINITY_DN90188_c0_g1_i1:68-910(+)